MKNWIYNGVEICDLSQFPKNTVGFVYKIINIHTNRFYIGKKILKTTRTKRLGKKELALREDKRTSKKKIIITESNWKEYFGSNEDLLKEVKLYGEDNFYREILHLCSNKGSLTYQEVRYQFLSGCLESNNCYNGQILGKFWKKHTL